MTKALRDARYPTAITGTWSDLERLATHIYSGPDGEHDDEAYELAEAVLVLLAHDRENGGWAHKRLARTYAARKHLATAIRSLNAALDEMELL